MVQIPLVQTENGVMSCAPTIAAQDSRRGLQYCDEVMLAKLRRRKAERERLEGWGWAGWAVPIGEAASKLTEVQASAPMNVHAKSGARGEGGSSKNRELRRESIPKIMA